MMQERAGLPWLNAPVIRSTVKGPDGTALAVYRIGTGDRLWVMPPAMGAPLLSMKFVLEHFSRDCTIVTWDQRGFFGSGIPSDRSAMSMDHHVGDMGAVIEAEQLDDFVLGGWSMAVQLSLEYYRRHPERVRALILINGPFEHALAGIGRTRLGEVALRKTIGAGIWSSAILNTAAPRVFGIRGLSRGMERVGLLAGNAAFFEEVMAEFSRIDWGRYLTMVRQMSDHSAADVLPRICVPTLITGGARDLLVPPSVAQTMHRAIPASELYLHPRATHYIVTEIPEELNARIEAFLGAPTRFGSRDHAPF